MLAVDSSNTLDANAQPTTAARSNSLMQLEKRLLRATGQAIADFNMIEDGDKIMVCLSGGKDSYTLLHVLMLLQQRAPVKFELIAVNLDQGQPGFPVEVLPNYLQKLGVPYQIVTQDTYSIVKDKIPEGKTTCSLCSRLRRGILYNTARSIGANKLALGHHRDDIIETLFLNLFFGGKIKSMPPKLKNEDGDLIVLRPLAYCNERDIGKFARGMGFPIIPCNLCGSQENAQRKIVKNMLEQWGREHPGRIESIARAIRQVVPSHLMDPNLFDFKTLSADQAQEIDTAFDGETYSMPLPTATSIDSIPVKDLRQSSAD